MPNSVYYYPPLASLPALTKLSSKTLLQDKVPPKDEIPDSLWLSGSTYSALQSASPIAHVKKVKANVLLFMGEIDNRVSPTQGRGYYHALRACGAVGLGQVIDESKPQQLVEMLTFPGEGHPLEGTEAYRVEWECAFDWLNRTTE